MAKKKKLTYKDIEPIVEYLVKVKSKQNTFDCWDVEDISQEIRIICLNALEEFDHKRATDEKHILNYFGRCVDNRLKNLKRDNYIRYTPPQINENDSEDEMLEKYIRYQEYISRKENIKHPVNIELVGEMPVKFDAEEQIIAEDIKTHLLDNIKDNLKAPLKNIIDGAKKDISNKTKKEIQDSVKDILDNCQ